jgi:hypothetical protein
MLATIRSRVFCLPPLLYRNVKVKIYKTIILPVVYGCTSWFAALREEDRLKAFENRVLRRIFGPKRDEVTGEWRKLHSEELHILYSSQNTIRQIKSRRIRWPGHVARMGEEKRCTRFCWKSPKERDHSVDRGADGKTGSEWILGRLPGGVAWVQLAQGRDQWRSRVNAVMNLRAVAPRSLLVIKILSYCCI